MSRMHFAYGMFGIMLLFLAACNNPVKKTSWQVTLSKEDKIPYGSFLAYQALPHHFPEAKVSALSRWQRYNSLADSPAASTGNKALLILVGLDFFLSGREWEELKEFIQAGNEVVLFCSMLDNKVQTELNCIKMGGGEHMPLMSEKEGRQNVNILRLSSDNNLYGHEGRTLNGYFIAGDDADANDSSLLGMDVPTTDEEKPDTLGYANEKVDFIRYRLGNGHLSLHAAPLVMSNYFLLQQGNRHYLNGIWSTLPANISHVYWQDYYKRTANGAGLSTLMSNPATRWAIIIGIFTLLLYVFFESKRRQRIIPIAEAPTNTSVSFVETVGRLYYNKGDHKNLADKMIQHFLEWVRLRYYLNTNEINETFTDNLKNKSGLPEAEVRRMVEMIHEVRMGNSNMSEAYLYELYSTIQLFYNTKNR